MSLNHMHKFSAKSLNSYFIKYIQDLNLMHKFSAKLFVRETRKSIIKSQTLNFF